MENISQVIAPAVTPRTGRISYPALDIRCPIVNFLGHRESYCVGGISPKMVRLGCISGPLDFCSIMHHIGARGLISLRNNFEAINNFANFVTNTCSHHLM